jgi:polar amino acid transport system substrate-binding protein
MKSRKATLFVLLILAMVVLSACAGNAQPEVQTASTLDRVKSEGVIRVGFANEAPFGYATASGDLTGESVEIAREIFTNLGIGQMEGILTEFGSLIPGLKANRMDAITAGMFVKPSRCEEVAFSEPHYCMGEALVVKAGNPFDVHSYEDVVAKMPDGMRLGVVAGGFEEDYWKSLGVAEDQMTFFPDGPTAIAGIQADRIDTFSLTALSVQSLLEATNDPNLERALPFTDPVIDGASVRGCGAVAFRLEDTDLRDAYNVELQKMKDSGRLLEILQQFGFTDQELPTGVTTAQLCTP